jgi:hypothetical protein
MSVHDRLTATGILRRYPACPVCGSPERHTAQRRPPMQDTYLLALARTLDVPYQDLHAALEVHECDRCASVYCDPWLGALGMASLYGRGHGQHLAGWENFLRWVQSTGPARPPVPEAVWSFLAERMGPVGIYGELNCPFSGLFLLFRDLDGGDQVRADDSARAIAGIHHSYTYPERLRGQLTRGRSLRARVARRLLGDDQASALSVARVRRRLTRPGAIGPARTPRADVRPAAATPPEKRYLVMEPSSTFWTTNCVAVGTSCRALCQSPAVGVPVIDWKDVAREEITFDLFGLFNCLDHFVDPGRLLREVLAHSRAVFVETHRGGANDTFSRQHLYAFGPRFLDHLLPSGWRWEDVTPSLDDGLQSFYWIWRDEGRGAPEGAGH